MDEQSIFLAALEKTTSAERVAYLNKACEGSATLRRRIDALLQRYDDAGSFLERPPMDLEGTVVASIDTHEAGSAPQDDSRTVVFDSSHDASLDFLRPSSKPGCLGTIGQYEINSIVGRGGMGLVLKANDTRLNRTVAVKVLAPELAANAAGKQRFLREARAAAAVTHPHVITIHAVDEDRVPYLVMEMVDGMTLRQKIDDVGMLEVKEILRIGAQIADGLGAAHKQGLIHRDVKPANILLENGVERVKITDFGLARAVNDLSVTRTGEVAGTPQYMSPEQAQGEPIDHRSDLFSLGSVLYTMCTGRPPFRGDNAIAVIRRVIDDSPRPICELNDEIPEWLGGIVDRLLQKNPDDRYQTATEVARLLEQHLAQLQHRVSTPAVTPPESAAMKKSGKSALQKAAADNSGDGQKSVSRGMWRKVLLPIGGIAAVAFLAMMILKNSNQNDTAVRGPVPEESKNEVATANQTSDDLDPGDSSGVEWHGWPADAPPPAIAPFDAVQAKKYQEQWAAYLKVPVEYENSIGMKFVLVPPGEFTMGSTSAEIEETILTVGDNKPWQDSIKSETPLHKVILTQPIYLGAHEVTQSHYEQVMGKNPSRFSPMRESKDTAAGTDTSTFPVESVSWNDATEFCARLSQRELLQPDPVRIGATGAPPHGTAYRLPSEAEWEFACRAGTTTWYWVGDHEESLASAAWFGALGRDATKDPGRTFPVGQLKSNPFGLYDVHGNVWEWVEDSWDAAYYGRFTENPAIDPHGPPVAGSQRILRGGGWRHFASTCRASGRQAFNPDDCRDTIGFRAALAVDAVNGAIAESRSTMARATVAWHGWAADAPQPAIAPFDAVLAKKHQEAWAAYLKIPVEFENSIGMKFRLVPPGEFTMGGTPEEIEAALKVANGDWLHHIRSEAPRHNVILTQPFFLGVHEVTQGQYERLMGQNPSHFASTGEGKIAVAGMDTTRHPVDSASWYDAAEFCTTLSLQEQRQPYYRRTDQAVSMTDGTGYRLPTEAQWEFACRAGTTTRYWVGNKHGDLLEVDWIGANAGGRTHPVGELKANPFGLSDVHGNLVEWVHGGWQLNDYKQFLEESALNPTGPFDSNAGRVLRGGAWWSHAYASRASRRISHELTVRHSTIGFRVALPIDAVKQARPKTVMTAAEPDRTAAELALSIGGKIHIRQNGQERPIGVVGDLPQETFELIKLNLSERPNVSDAWLAQFQDCGNLISLVLDQTEVSDAGLVHFKKCKNLAVLGLGGTIVSDAGLSHLKECKNLWGLWLYSTRVSDAALVDTIKELPNISTLNVAYSRVSDAGLIHLKDYKNLTTLVLSGCKVSDAGLEYLADCRKLLSVSVENTQVTEAGVKKLSTALPRCTIKWDRGENGPK